MALSMNVSQPSFISRAGGRSVRADLPDDVFCVRVGPGHEAGEQRRQGRWFLYYTFGLALFGR